MSEKPESLPAVRAKIRRDRKLIEAASARVLENLRLAVQLGAGAPDLAEDSGYSVSRIGQLVGGVRKVRAEAGASAPKRRAPKRADEDQDEPAEPPEPSGIAALPARYQPGATARVRQLLHPKGLLSDFYAATYTERATIFVEVDTGEWWSPAGKHGHIPWSEGTAAELLAGLGEGLAEVERVFFVGSHRPGVTPERTRAHGSAADAARTWFLADVPGWQAVGHYLVDDVNLIGRWEHLDSARSIEVQRAHMWFGEGTYSAADAAFAWSLLRRAVAAEFPGGVLLSSPATTGRDLWRRSISRKGGGFPVLSEELRELIQTTSGQGRRELVARPADVPTDSVMGLVTQYDMRLAYAALAWGMPVGAPTMVTGREFGELTDEDQAKTLARRGRWLVRATVPGGWEQVGILPTPQHDGTWAWPSRPGTTFTSWCSASELAVARLHGWRCEVLEGFHFNEGKPLNTWKDKLVAIHSRTSTIERALIAGMVRSAARMMILSTVGAFASRAHPVTRSVPVTDDAQLPDDAPIREVGGMYVWEEPGQRSEWMERVSHPEWSAEIWGRCRARLLVAPGPGGSKTGALHVSPGTVIGMRTDGITLLGDPEWRDDGAPGRYRLKGRMRGAFHWPATDAALSDLKRAAEGAYETGEMQ